MQRRAGAWTMLALGALLAGCADRRSEVAAVQTGYAVGSGEYPGGPADLAPLPNGILPPALYTTPVTLGYPSLAAPPAVWFAREMVGFDTSRGRSLRSTPGSGQSAAVLPPAGVAPTLDSFNAPQQGAQSVVPTGTSGTAGPVPPPLRSAEQPPTSERLPPVRSTPFFARGLDSAPSSPREIPDPPRAVPVAPMTGGGLQPIAGTAAPVSAAPPAGFYAVPTR